MAGIAVSSHVIARNEMGRFIEDCKLAARQTVEDLVNEGADLSRALAPSGHKVDPRTTKLKASISSTMVSRTHGYWYAEARHAMAQEFGAGPHPIPGNVSFLWEREGRWWIPGTNTINHPGNPAQPYLRPAYQAVAPRAIAVANRYYPH